MKRTFVILIVTILIALGLQIYMNWGYNRIDFQEEMCHCNIPGEEDGSGS